MEKFSKQILKKGDIVGNGYENLIFIKKGLNAEAYRVKAKNGKIYFLKIFNYSKLHRNSFDDNNNLLESSILKNISHANIVSFVESGETIIDSNKYGYLVLEFIAGETLEEKFCREKINTIYDLKLIISGILEALKYLHNLEEPIIHNEISLQNIMIDMSGKISVPKLIDFGHARSFYQSSSTYLHKGLNPYYKAPECFNGIFSPQSDLFSVGALMYNLLCGTPPWFDNLNTSQLSNSEIEEIILESRKNKLSFFEIENTFMDYDQNLSKIINKALCYDSDFRFKSADEFLRVLSGEIEIEELDENVKQRAITNSVKKNSFITKKAGNGFDAIAGMNELKEQLTLEVVNAFKNPEEYEKYKVTIPNGMLLYGPPGCGKTFFSKCLAEEVGFNFIEIKPSSLQSKWVNATQENIANMFKEAEANAPTFIFIDEIDALVPSREKDLHEMHSNAVNEFLAQMNNLGEKSIFVIGASNRPEKIDTAILRSGRLDKKIFVPTPDYYARKALFEMFLNNRPLDFGINYDELAENTDNYVSSDIQLIVNESARTALKEKVRINMKILNEVILITKPSVPLSELKKYEAIRLKMESGLNADEIIPIKNQMGFEIPKK